MFVNLVIKLSLKCWSEKSNYYNIYFVNLFMEATKHKYFKLNKSDNCLIVNMNNGHDEDAVFQ